LPDPQSDAHLARVNHERTRRLTAISFADIVGFTAHTARDEDAAIQFVTEFKSLALSITEAHNGRIVEFIGDEALSVFDSAENAVRAALALSEAFKRATQEGKLRVGIHLGEITEAPDGGVFGDGVNTASRVQGVAEPGQLDA